VKASEVFEKLVNRAIAYCMRYPSIRYSPDKYQGTPGELLKHLSEEERKDLGNLKSEDISSDVISKEQTYLHTEMTPRTGEQYGNDIIKEEKSKFDKRMKT